MVALTPRCAEPHLTVRGKPLKIGSTLSGWNAGAAKLVGVAVEPVDPMCGLDLAASRNSHCRPKINGSAIGPRAPRHWQAVIVEHHCRSSSLNSDRRRGDRPRIATA